jgi:hypothetical protein
MLLVVTICPVVTIFVSLYTVTKYYERADVIERQSCARHVFVTSL